MEQIISLVIPFIALAILSVMIDRLTLFLEGIMNRLPGFPDKLEWWAAYLLVVGFSYLVCWQGDFSLFVYLDFQFVYPEQGYFLTALAISGGSAFIRTQFNMINDIPSAIFGATANVKSIFRRNEVQKNHKGEKLYEQEVYEDAFHPAKTCIKQNEISKDEFYK